MHEDPAIGFHGVDMFSRCGMRSGGTWRGDLGAETASKDGEICGLSKVAPRMMNQVGDGSAAGKHLFEREKSLRFMG
jgi:hypothetical protein